MHPVLFHFLPQLGQIVKILVTADAGLQVKPDLQAIQIAVKFKKIDFNTTGCSLNCRAGTDIQHSLPGFSFAKSLHSIDAIGRNQFMRIFHVNIGSWETQFASQPVPVDDGAGQGEIMSHEIDGFSHVSSQQGLSDLRGADGHLVDDLFRNFFESESIDGRQILQSLVRSFPVAAEMVHAAAGIR